MTMFNKDLYEILEVSPNASEEVIKNAYRALAKKLHPDTYPEPLKKEAEIKFKELNLAYEILINSTKRAEYDRNYRGTDSNFTKHPKDVTSTNTKSGDGTQVKRSGRNIRKREWKGLKVSNSFALITIICILIIAVLGKVASLQTFATNSLQATTDAQSSQQFTLPSQSPPQPRSQATHSGPTNQATTQDRPNWSTEVDGIVKP